MTILVPRTMHIPHVVVPTQRWIATSIQQQTATPQTPASRLLGCPSAGRLQGQTRSDIQCDTGAEAASKSAQGWPSALLNRWRASCPAQHHEKQRHTRHECLTNRAVCFRILLETRDVKCCRAIHTSRLHFVPQLQML